jgi:class 3 adenylate cyclase/HAMP domain-containing protein
MAAVENADLRRRSPAGLFLRYILLVPFFLITAGLAWFTWGLRDGLTMSAFERRMPLKNPVAVAWDGKDHLYALDDKYFRIVQMDLQGQVTRQLRVQADDRGRYSYWSELAVDPEGVLFTSKVVYSVETEIVEWEEISRIQPDGGEKVLYILKHEGDTEAYDTRILTLQVREGWLYFDVRGDETVALWRVALQGGDAQKVLDIPSGRADVYNMAGTSPGALWITSYSGDRVWRLNAEGSLVDAGFSPAAPEVPPIVLADKVFPAPGGGVYITDLFNQCVYRGSADGKLETWLSKADLPDKPPRALFKDIWAAADGRMAVVESIKRAPTDDPAAGEGGRLVVYGADRKVVKEFTAGIPSQDLWMRMLLPWLFLGLAALAFIGTALYAYIAIFSRRVSLVLKLIIAFVPLVIASVAFVAVSTFTGASSKVEEEIRFRLAALAQAGQHAIDGDAVDRIQRPSDYLGEDYNKVAEELDTLLGGSSDPWNQRIFANIVKLYNGMFYIMDDSSAGYGVLYPLPVAPFDRYKEALDSGRIVTYEYTDADGTFLEAAAPVRNGQGATVAVLYVGSSKDDLMLLQAEFQRGVTVNAAIVAGALLVAIVLVSMFLLLSVGRLRGAVGRMSKGDWGVQVRIRSRDEIGDLGQGFNVMSSSLKRHITEVTSMSDAYARFVPREFLRFLRKEKIEEIALGNQVEMDMGILFADIRSFTEISESMKPQENFNFLNSYLSRMGPVIRRHGGFIDKYLGDGIMALFPRIAGDGVRAAVEMQGELVVYNGHRAKSGYRPISVGVGVHAGRVMLGILGELERLEGTVIADAVNLTSRLQGLTKTYGARIVTSDEAVRSMGDKAPEHRFLGRALVRGRSRAVSIVEVFAADPPAEMKLKRDTKSLFEQAVRHFLGGKKAEALRGFNAVRDANPADKAAVFYIAACTRWKTGG